ncbi:hypothetical protein NW754_008787 [Fusarium falciforme]|nr:hypothetical protein NW754_008787 [Fusarium falciforme]
MLMRRLLHHHNRRPLNVKPSSSTIPALSCPLLSSTRPFCTLLSSSLQPLRYHYSLKIKTICTCRACYDSMVVVVGRAAGNAISMSLSWPVEPAGVQKSDTTRSLPFTPA